MPTDERPAVDAPAEGRRPAWATSGSARRKLSQAPARKSWRHGARAGQGLIVTTYDTDENVFDALQAGASGLLLKEPGPDELLQAIRVVADGDALLSSEVTRRL